VTGIKPFILILKMISSFNGDAFTLIDPLLNISRYFNTLQPYSVEFLFAYKFEHPQLYDFSVTALAV